MRAVVQRVTRAKVTVDEKVLGEIGRGLVVLLGIARDDTKVEAAYLVDKIAARHIFDDEDGKMNISIKDGQGALLVVPQFPWYGDVGRGVRRSGVAAGPPEVAEPLYDFFVRQAGTMIDEIATGSYLIDRKSTRPNSTHTDISRMPSSA